MKLKNKKYLIKIILCLSFILVPHFSIYLYSQENIRTHEKLRTLATMVDFSPGIEGKTAEILITHNWQSIIIDPDKKAKGAVLNFSKKIQKGICIEKPEDKDCALDLVLELKTQKSGQPLGKIFSDSWSTSNAHSAIVNIGDFAIVPLQEGKIQIKRPSDEEISGRYDSNSYITIHTIALFY